MNRPKARKRSGEKDFPDAQGWVGSGLIGVRRYKSRYRVYRVELPQVGIEVRIKNPGTERIGLGFAAKYPVPVSVEPGLRYP